jgi:hypothetical protein
MYGVDRRVAEFSDEVRSERFKGVETVGKLSRYFQETVLVILEPTGYPGMSFLLCSANRGVARGEPALVGSHVWAVREFPAAS